VLLRLQGAEAPRLAGTPARADFAWPRPEPEIAAEPSASGTAKRPPRQPRSGTPRS